MSFAAAFHYYMNIKHYVKDQDLGGGGGVGYAGRISVGRFHYLKCFFKVLDLSVNLEPGNNRKRILSTF